MEFQPGSKDALNAGCLCPVADNGFGRGSGQVGEDGKPLFWVNSQCPLHGDDLNRKP